MSGCEVTDCTRPHHSRGMCQLHYQRWRNTTDDFIPRDMCVVVDAEPLLRLAEQYRPWTERFGNLRFSLILARRKGRTSLVTVDRVCDALQVHPCEVYGDVYWKATG